MIKQLLDSISTTINGLPFYTPTGVKKSRPVVLPIVSCSSLRRDGRYTVMAITVSVKHSSLTNLYSEVEAIIQAVTLPGFIDWANANIATGTDGHYAEIFFDARQLSPHGCLPNVTVESIAYDYHTFP
jgi:hypothetical protein